MTIDFETVLKKGVNYIQNQAEIALQKYKGTEKEPFAQSCIHCLNCMREWHKRYLDELKDKTDCISNYENLKNVPFEPARNFYEAVQSIWFTFAFVRLCGNWPGIGRIDWLLGNYLEKDLADGTLTLDDAREILAHFFIKGCEWIRGGNYGSGDAQHYQNILLAGIDENGIDVISSLIKGFCTLGGHFMQIDIADTAMLKDAQMPPENYQTLSVRVSGWNARFVTLNKEWQDMIILQTGSEL